jgi:hypothetical protein
MTVIAITTVSERAMIRMGIGDKWVAVQIMTFSAIPSYQTERGQRSSG